jgi:hypothetical protein
MEQKTIIGLILGILVLVSLVQAFQLNGLKEKINSGTLKVSAASSASPVTASSGKTVGSVPASVKELPQMVGGC